MNGWVMVDGDWVHRPWWKRAINIPLRAVQWGRPYQLLLVSECTISGNPPLVLGYSFGWIRILTAAEVAQRQAEREERFERLKRDAIDAAVIGAPVIVADQIEAGWSERIEHYQTFFGPEGWTRTRESPRSSEAEQAPLKGCVAGSNPAAGILPTDPDGSTVTE